MRVLGNSMRLLGSVAVVLSLGACSGRDEATPEFSDEFELEMTSTMQRIVDDLKLPGLSVHVEDPSGSAWSRGIGQASLETHAALTPAHQLRAGSNIKPWIAAAILQHVERGQLSLDATLTELLDEGTTSQVPNPAQVTVRMLLQHRSGIPDWVTDEAVQMIMADPTHVWTLDDMLARITGQPALFDAGMQYGYSNTNYTLLGEILETVSGRSWRAILAEDVLARAGVSEDALPTPGHARCDGCARGYQDVGAEAPVDVTEIDPSMAGAAGGHALVVTPTELSALLRALFEGDLFERRDTLDRMREFSPAGTPDVDSYGLGLIESDYGGVKVTGHLGGTAGYFSFNLFLPDHGYYFSGFTNTSVGLEFLEPATALVGVVASAD